MRFLILILCFASCVFGLENWAHLELGAGNYGKTGGKAEPDVQYRVLFWTLDELVTRFGPVGTVHINDIKPPFAEYAVECLREYALEKGYSHVSIYSLPGDYKTLDFQPTLKSLGKHRFTSIHLKNPEQSFYGWTRRGKTDHRTETRIMLQKLANLAEDGIHLFILDQPHFLPEAEKTEFIDKGIFYQPSSWDDIDYWGPGGHTISNGRTLFIPRAGLAQQVTSPSLP